MLICSSGGANVDVLRGLMRDIPGGVGRIAATGPEAPALIDFIMSKECPVSASLTTDDKVSLLRIKQDNIEAGR